MEELLFFYIPSCPHCKLAIRFLEELKGQDDRYKTIAVKMIDETKEKALANSYDYWYVPCFFRGGKKLFEGHAEKADVQGVLEACLA